MVGMFDDRNEFLLVIVSECTHEKVATIKTGIWHIAQEAQVSIICWYLDNENKEPRWFGEVTPGEDKHEELMTIQKMYADAGYRVPLGAASPANPSGFSVSAALALRRDRFF